MHVWNIPGVNRNVTGSMTDVTCAVVVERGMVLVTQRSEQMDHPLKWEFPGGKVKEGETPESCIRREIREELGLTVMVKLRLPVVVHRYGHREVRLIPFVCVIEGGTLSLREHKAYRWVPPGDLDRMDWLEADVEVVRNLKEVWIRLF